MDYAKNNSWRSYTLLIAISVLTLYVDHVIAIEPCVNGIDIHRHTQYNLSIGETFSLKCPVRFCSEGAPNMTWCKHNGGSCQPIDTDSRISFEWTEYRAHYAVYLLKFQSINLTDSGFYGCSAKYKDQQTVGHLVRINIAAGNTTYLTTSTTGEIMTSDVIKYTVSSLGALCMLIIILSLLIYCMQRKKAKHKTTSQTGDAEQEIRNDSEYASDILQLKISEAAIVSDETIDENSVMETTPDYTTEQDSVVYADLNHSAGRMINNICMDDDQIEYATVHLKSNSQDFFPSD
ncbi:B- and T-lymphocyte attenuator-like isoform X2 [Pelobates fuscus]|uniref:B- and T-lymphocyte attenuator-like isoform X2 n=1 Tax=Pelobates fuscus TaxID=191477 RepID=UPI002FE4BA0F